MKALFALLAVFMMATPAFAEPVAGRIEVGGTLAPEKVAVVPLQLLGNESTYVHVKANGPIACGIYTTDRTPVVDDTNGDNVCDFRLVPKATIDVLLAVGNAGDTAVEVTVVVQ